MTFLLGLLEAIIPAFKPPVPTGSIRSVLVVDFNYLGDMLLSSPVYRALKQNVPGVRVEALVFRFTAPAIEANPYVDRLHIVDTPSFLRQLLAMFRLRKSEFDLVLQLNTSLRTNFLMFFVGTSYRLGYNYKHRGCLNNIRIPIQTRTSKSHNRIDECVELLEKGFGWRIEQREMIFVVQGKAIERVNVLLAESGIHGDELLVGMHTNTRQTQNLRRWNQANFASVASVLIERHNATVIFTGADGDQDYVGEIIKQVLYPDKTLNVVGVLSLQELAALLKRLHVFITLNTGPMHLAISQRTPTVALIGGTPASVVFPIGNPRFEYIMDPGLAAWQPEELTARYTPAMDSISVDQVLNKVDLVMDSSTHA